MSNKIQTQSASWRTKIKNKLFSTRKMKVVSAIVFLAVGGAVFFSANYFVKGATYGWLQATWSGGVLPDHTSCEAQDGTWDASNSVCMATHTDNNQSGWTAYSSKDDNADTSNDELTLSSTSKTVENTTTTDFLNGSWLHSGNSTNNELKLDCFGEKIGGICVNNYGWRSIAICTLTTQMSIADACLVAAALGANVLFRTSGNHYVTPSCGDAYGGGYAVCYAPHITN